MLLLLFRLRRPALGPLLGLAIALVLTALAWYSGFAEAARPHVDRWIRYDPTWDRQCHTLGPLTFVPIVTLVPLVTLWLTRRQTKEVLDQAIVIGIASALAFFAAGVATLFVTVQHLACDTL